MDSPRVVEADAVRVPGVAPHENDVLHEGAAVVGCRWHVHGAHAPAVDVHSADRPNPRLRIPRRSVDDLGVVRERLRRSRDHEVLATDVARADHPPSPELAGAARSQSAGANDVETSGRGARSAVRAVRLVRFGGPRRAARSGDGA